MKEKKALDGRPKVPCLRVPVGPPIDKKYRTLSYQLFGNPVGSPQQQETKCPLVDLSGEQVHLENYVAPEPPQKRKQRRGRNPMPTYNTTGPLGRCLICYSIVSKQDRRKMLGLEKGEEETPSSLSVKTKKKAESLLEFLKLLALRVPVLNKTDAGHASTKAVFENAVKRLQTRPWYLCLICNAACDQLLTKYRKMKELQQEVNAFHAKFLSAVKLSLAFSEKDPELIKASDDEYEDDHEDGENSCGKLVDDRKRTKITLRMKTLDVVRRCLLGGNWGWSGNLKSVRDYVHFDLEVKRNPEPLKLLKMKKIDKVPGMSTHQDRYIKWKESNKPHLRIPRTRKLQPKIERQHKSSLDLGEMSTISSVAVHFVKQENEDVVAESLAGEDSGIPVVCGNSIAVKKRGSRPRKRKVPITKDNSSCQNAVSISTNNPIKTEKDDAVFSCNFDSENNFASSPISLQPKLISDEDGGRGRHKLSSLESDSGSNEILIQSDLQPVNDFDDKLIDHFSDDHSDDPDFPPDGGVTASNHEDLSSSTNLKVTSNDANSTGEPDTSTRIPSCVQQDKKHLKLLKAREAYQKLRDEFPNMTYPEICARLKKTRSERNSRRRGLPGLNRLPITELKCFKTGKNQRHLKFRLTYGKTMSEPAYRKLQREKKKKIQNVTSDGLPSRGSRGNRGIKCNRVENGRLLYRGDIEIQKNKEGKYACPYCDRYEPISNKGCLIIHLNRHHLDTSQAHECDQCEERFYYHFDLLTHKKVKHGGGYQCEVCGANLADRSALFYHKRVKHQGIKPHICEHCGKGFATKKDMTIHVRRHTGERPFVCHVCAEAFIDKPSMKLHVRRKHPEIPPEETQELKPRKVKISSGALNEAKKDMDATIKTDRTNDS